MFDSPETEALGIVGFMLVLVFGLVMLVTSVYYKGVNATKQQAVKNTNACYYVDKDNTKQFTWDCSTIDKEQ